MKKLFVLFSLMFFSTLSAFTVEAASSDCEQQACVAVVDNGSTGSRLHIYVYDSSTARPLSNIKEIWSKKIKPGLATVELNQQNIDSFLNTLFIGAPAL